MNAAAGGKSLRPFAYLLAARWLRDGAQAVFLIFLARHSMDTYGNIMLAMNMGQILLFCSEFGINQHFILLLANRSAAPSAVLRQITLLKAALLMVGGLCLTAFALWQGYSHELLAMALIIGFAFGLDSFVNSYYVICQSLGRQDMEARLRGVAALFGYGAGLLALFSGASPLIIALFKPIESLTSLAGAAKMLRRSWEAATTPLWSAIWATWKGTFPFTLMALAAILYNKINLFFLQSFGGAQAVAQYSATWQLVDGISVLASGLLLGNVLFPVFAKLWVKDQQAFASKAQAYAAQLAALSLPLVFVLGVCSELIIALLYGDQYSEAARVQPLLSLCIFFAFVHNLAYYLLLSMRKHMLVLGFFVAGLAVNTALCLQLVPGAPLDGAVWAIVATKGFVALLTVGSCQRFLKLFTLRVVLGLLFAATGAVGLTFAGRSIGRPLFGEALALLLLLLHLWRCYKLHIPRESACSQP